MTTVCAGTRLGRNLERIHFTIRMSVKAKVEAIIYATEEPVTLNQLASLLRDTVLAELRAEEDARLALNEVVSDGKPSSPKMTNLPITNSENRLRCS